MLLLLPPLASYEIRYSFSFHCPYNVVVKAVGLYVVLPVPLEVPPLAAVNHPVKS
jgi:hypothetical protein